MQAPPEQPIGPGGYPRPPGYGVPEKFVADMVMGIILIVLASIGACGSLALVGIGGVGAAAGGTAAAQRGSGGAELAAAGGMVMIIGIGMLIACVAQIVGGAFMIKSLKKGFMIVLVVGVIYLILNLIQLNFIGLIVGLIFPGYSAARLFGNFGPRPA